MLLRICPWCRRTAFRAVCSCLPEAPGTLLARSVDGVDLTVAVHRYDKVLRRFLLAAKNGGRRDIVGLLGSQLAQAIRRAHDAGEAPAVDLSDRPTVVWVPASRHGRRGRGYDQARLLARAVAHHLDLPITPLLTRIGGQAQAGRHRHDRMTGPGIGCRLAQAPPVVLLIDDVITTGSSLKAAARALRGAGTMTVMAAAVASAGW